jgi:hypothetical protein
VRPEKFYQFTAIDDCTRLRVLKAYSRCNQKTAIQFHDYLLARLPFRVEVIQTDTELHADQMMEELMEVFHLD